MPSSSRRHQSRQTTVAAGQDASEQGTADHGNAANSSVLDGVEPEAAGLLDSLMSAPAEWSKVEAGTLKLSRGSRGPAVEWLQQQLGIDADGVFGRGTKAAVEDYQRSNGLESDGVVGRGTAANLGGGAAPPASETRTAEARDAASGALDSGAGEQSESGQSNEEGPVINVSAGQFESLGLQEATLRVALQVYRNAWAKGDTTSSIYTIIDFGMLSREKRMFVMDLESGELLHNALVTHGKYSGENKTDSFSNKEGSNQSSIGLARTAETYNSRKFGGTALRLDGLEEGYNDNMRDRAVVMHQADYARQSVADKGARLGRSLGCPAMDPAVAGEIIETIKNGTLVFSYHPEMKDYIAKSQYMAGTEGMHAESDSTSS